MKAIALYEADQIHHLVWPENVQQLTLKSPADAVFTDFLHHQPLVLGSDTLAVEAEQIMRRSHVRLEIVLNCRQEFVGVVALEDLSESEIIKKVAMGLPRDELRVADMMRRRQQLRVFDYQDLVRMTVADVLEVLKQYGHQHCLVGEREPQLIRGILSASDVARKLKVDIAIAQPPKFAELYRALHPH